MKKKWIWLFILLSLFNCTREANQSDVKILKLGHILGQTHPVHLGMVEFARIVEEESAGSIKVIIFPDGQLGNERELTELLQAGAIDLVKSSAAALEPFASDYMVLSLPFLFDDMDHHLRVLRSDIGEEMLALTLDKGFIGITYYNAGTRNFYTSKPILQPSDLRGSIVRVQMSKIPVRMMELLGANATPLAYGEVYTALQQKVIDVAENNLPSYADSKHSEVAKHFTFSEHSMIPDILIMNYNVWSKFSTQDQQIIKQAALASFDYQSDLWLEMEAKYMADLSVEGVTFHTIDKQPFQDLVSPMYEEAMMDIRAKYFIEQIRNLSNGDSHE